jgi:hypothetical protein
VFADGFHPGVSDDFEMVAFYIDHGEEFVGD